MADRIRALLRASGTSSAELDSLAERIAAAAPAAKAASTWRKYLPHWTAFTAFCSRNGVEPFGAATSVVACFLQLTADEAAQRGAGFAVVESASAAIFAMHEAVGLASPTAAPLYTVVRRAAANTLVTQHRDLPFVTAAALVGLKLRTPQLLAGSPRTRALSAA